MDGRGILLLAAESRALADHDGVPRGPRYKGAPLRHSKDSLNRLSIASRALTIFTCHKNMRRRPDSISLLGDRVLVVSFRAVCNQALEDFFNCLAITSILN